MLENPTGDTSLRGLGVCGSNTKMDVKEVACDGMDWVRIAKERVQKGVLVNMLTNIWVR